MLLCAVVAGTCIPARADAQEEVTARDRQAAAEAYDRGTAAYLARDYARAAQWFETAHRLAPASAALVEAARAYERADARLRAATVGLALTALYPDDRNAARMAERVLRFAPRFVRVDVQCEGCTLSVDGAVMEHRSFFVEPDTDHVIEAAFEHGAQRESVRGAAGETRSITFTAPAPPIAEPEPEPPAEPEPEPQPVRPPPPSSTAVVPWPVTLVGIILSAGAGAALVWSGVDALDGVPAYEANPTREALADGQMREERTNWLIAAASVLAATTLVLAIFTDWDDGEPQAAVAIQADGALAALRGRF